MELIHCYASILKPTVYPQVPFSSHRQLRLSWQARWCLLSVQRLNQFSCCMNHFLFFLSVFFCALLAFASSSKMRFSTRVTELPEKHNPCFHNNASKNCQFASFFSGKVVLTHSTSWQLSWYAALWLGFVFCLFFARQNSRVKRLGKTGSDANVQAEAGCCFWFPLFSSMNATKPGLLVTPQMMLTFPTCLFSAHIRGINTSHKTKLSYFGRQNNAKLMASPKMPPFYICARLHGGKMSNACKLPAFLLNKYRNTVSPQILISVET